MDDLALRPIFDADGSTLTVVHTQDVEPILEANKLKRMLEQPSDWGREIADIPNVIYVQWLNEEHARGNTSLRMFTAEFDAIVHRKLQDPDWAYLRTDKPALQAGWSVGLL